jgi:DNA-binding IclR family transcriptional regulator
MEFCCHVDDNQRMPKASMAKDADEGVASMPEHPSILDKAFEILLAFNGRDRVLTLTELARASGLPKSTVHRLLARLVRLEAVERHGEGYKLGLGLVRLSATTLAGHLRDVALPYLTELRRWSGHTAQLAVLRQGDVVYLERLHRQGDSLATEVGMRLPACRTAMGRAILAFLPEEEMSSFVGAHVTLGSAEPFVSAEQFMLMLREVRREGLAQEHDEIMPGMSCLAAPIVPVRYANAAISLAYRSGAPLPVSVSAALREAAALISRELRTGLIGDHNRWLSPHL